MLHNFPAAGAGIVEDGLARRQKKENVPPFFYYRHEENGRFQKVPASERCKYTISYMNRAHEHAVGIDFTIILHLSLLLRYEDDSK